jgi:mannose-6-phosphate isomerase-like protein (cupin superfamily)
MEQSLALKRLPIGRDAVAPDGSDVRILLGLKGGGMAHFRLSAGETSIAVTHRTVEEIWYFVEGHGEMWRKLGDSEQIDQVEPGVCLTVPLGTHFQFRATGPTSLGAVGVTMPPWPGEGEARIVDGKWTPTVPGAAPR